MAVCVSVVGFGLSVRGSASGGSSNHKRLEDQSQGGPGNHTAQRMTYEAVRDV